MSVEVRQEDFEQAARYYCAHPFGSSKQDELAKLLKRAESEDIDALSYLFAAHRHQAEEAMRERAATKVKQRLALIPTLTDRAGSAVLACLPDAIRSIDTRGE